MEGEASMFQIKTYIYVPCGPKQGTSEIPMDDIDALKRAGPDMSLEDLEGHIDLSYYGAPILDDRLGDWIHFTWQELVDAINSFAEKGCGCAGIWSSPVSMCLKRTTPRLVLLKVNDEGWLWPKGELLAALIDGALQFYEGMFRAFRSNKKEYHDCLELKRRLIRKGHIRGD